MIKQMDRRKGAPRSRDIDTEQRILDAARTVFLRRGTAGARMQEIAREAGVNQALLHYYFRSKERLSAAVFQQIASRIFPALVQTLAGEVSLDEKIDGVIGVYLENLSRNPFVAERLEYERETRSPVLDRANERLELDRKSVV